MEERYTSRELLNVDSNISDLGSNITEVNGSGHHGISFCDIISCTMILLSLIFALAGLVGNGIVLWLLGFHVPKNPFSVYILNLAGADFLFICFQIVYCLHIVLDIFYLSLISLPSFSFVLVNFAYLCGLSILYAISIERCLSVMWPIWYRCQRPKHTSAVICTLLWVLSLLLSILEGKECGYLFDSLGWCQTFDFITTAWLITLFVVLLGSSLALVVTIFLGSHRIPLTRLYMIIVSTVLAFLLLSLPYGIYWFLIAWIEIFHNVMPCDFYPVTIFLSCVNSCANPIIYFFVGSIRHRRFQRRTLKLLLQRAMQDTPEEEEHREMGPSARFREI